MSSCLKQLISWWFIVQIVLPFTAPLQTLSLYDLLGTKAPHSSQTLPESTTTPTISDVAASVAVVPLMSPITMVTPAAFGASAALAARVPLTSAFRLQPSQQHQHSVLRL